MGKSDRERLAVEAVLSRMPELAGYQDISGNNQERPDFVYKKDDVILGLEHIEIPLLTVETQNADRLFQSKTKRFYNDWKDIYDQNYEATTKAIELLINNHLENYASFSHHDYLENVMRLLGIFQEKRMHNATEYLKLLREKWPNSLCKIGFVLDINYQEYEISRFRYKASPLDEFHTERRLDFPFTMTFLCLLRFVLDVDVFYIVWHPFNDYKSKNLKVYSVYIDEKRNITENSKISRIWWEFDMPEALKKGKITLDFEYEK